MQRPLKDSLRATPEAKSRAKELRQRTTPPEFVLWSRLRSKRLGGLHFRRQHPIGPWIADFCCVEAALVVEIDGGFHQGDAHARDAARDHWFEQRRVRVMRISASDVSRNRDLVLNHILEEAMRRIATFAEEP